MKARHAYWIYVGMSAVMFGLSQAALGNSGLVCSFVSGYTGFKAFEVYQKYLKGVTL